MDPIDYERYCAWLYTKEGYRVAETKTSGDEGIDLLLTKANKKVVVQCKRYANNVGQPVVRDLYGAMFHVAATEAHLCTTGRISRQAESWAAGKPIELIDGNDMVAWANKWRRQETQGRGANIIWTTAAIAVFGVIVLAALALMAGGWFFFQRRTVRPTATPVIAIPNLPTPTSDGAGGAPEPITQITPQVTEEPEETEEASTDGDEETETPEPVATATLKPTDEPTEPAASTVNVNIPRRQSSIQIDGSLDEWGEPIAISNVIVYSSSQWDGSDDVEANWYLSWDEQALYVAALVIDDTHAQYSQGAESFRGDSLELQLDTDRAGDFGNGISADEVQLELSPGNFGDIPPQAWRFVGSNSGVYLDAPSASISVAASEAPFGYFIEARIPWSDLNVTPSAGLVIGANLNVNDNDTAAPLQELMKSNVATRSYANPTTWGSLTLAE